MKIAFSADLHLTQIDNGRFDYVRSLFSLLQENNINTLVVAGDFFDHGAEGYIQLDDLLKEFPDFSLLIVPGNHDSRLSQKQFGAKNIRVIEEPAVITLDDNSFPLLCLPYRTDQTMGALLEESGLLAQLRSREWVLVSHGDYGRFRPEDKGGESSYFPLSAQEVALFKPALVLLGHIHKPCAPAKNIYYMGSPWPLSINETGPRRVLLCDLQTAHVTSLQIDFVPLYMKLVVQLVPDGNELAQLEGALERFFVDVDPSRSLVGRVCLCGCSSDRGQLEEKVEGYFADKGAVLQQIDSSGLRFVEEGGVTGVVSKLKDSVEHREYPFSDSKHFRQKVMHAAFQILYPEKRGH